MQKIFILNLLVFSLFINAQNRHINFETGNLASVFEKAKKENKLIFVDAYTSWCGPCKWMAANVFANDTVADYFNKTFVNYKLDMEKGEGPEFAKKHTVQCYPSLLFIDGDANLVHRGAGGLPAKYFIELAENSLIPGKTFTAQKNGIEKVGFNESNILSYLQLLSGSCLDVKESVNTYLGKIKNEDLAKRTNWMLLRDYVNDLKNPLIQYFTSHISEFQTKFGKDTVDEKLSKLGSVYFNKYTYAEDRDNAGFEKAKKDFIALKWPGAKAAIFNADLSYYVRFDPPKYYELAAAEYLKYYNDNANFLNSMAWTFYKVVTDKSQLKSAATMAKRACELKREYAHLDTYAAVLYKGGDYKQAETIAIQAIEAAKSEKVLPDDYKDTSELLRKIKEKL